MHKNNPPTELRSEYLAKLIPLPDQLTRRESFLWLRKVHPGFNVEQGPDYLCLLSLSVVLKIGSAIYLLLLLDAFLGFGLLLEGQDIKERILALPAEQTKIMCLPAYLTIVLFYLRIRLNIDLRNDWIPIAVHPARLSEPQPGQWFLMSLFLLFVSIAIVTFAHISSLAVIGYFGMQEVPFLICIIVALQVFGVALCAALFPMSALLLEKSYRYFDCLQKQLQVLVIQRDETTDKYKGNHTQRGE